MRLEEKPKVKDGAVCPFIGVLWESQKKGRE